MSSFAKFVILLFVISLIITSVTTFILYKTRYLMYINIITPAILSLFVGFVVSTVPTKGFNDKKN